MSLEQTHELHSVLNTRNRSIVLHRAEIFHDRSALAEQGDNSRRRECFDHAALGVPEERNDVGVNSRT